jgi:gamma-glutamylputrescine oxidase
MSAPSSLWQVEQPWAAFAPLRGDAAADVVVIGAGVTGCACALRLAQGGASVLVVEADRVASGASGRNGGFASAGTGLGLRDAAGVIGMEAALALHRATEAALDEMLALAAGHGEADSVRRTGSLWLATSGEADEMAAAVAALGAAGVACRAAPELIPPRMRARYPRATVPRRLRAAARAVGAGAGRRGGRGGGTGTGALAGDRGRAARGRVERRDPGGRRHRPGRRRRVRRAPPPARPGARRHPLSGARPDARDRATRRSGGHTPHPLRPRLNVYARPTLDGRLAIGGCRLADLDAEYTDETGPTPPVQAALDRFVAERLGLAGVRVTHRWGGTMGFSADLLPVVGEVPGRPGLHVAGGYSGVGNVQGFVCGGMIADLILGRRHALAAALSLERFAVDGGLRPPAELREQRESRRLRDLPPA